MQTPLQQAHTGAVQSLLGSSSCRQGVQMCAGARRDKGGLAPGGGGAQGHLPATACPCGAPRASSPAKSSWAAAVAGVLPNASKGSEETAAAEGRGRGAGAEPGRGSNASAGSLNSIWDMASWLSSALLHTHYASQLQMLIRMQIGTKAVAHDLESIWTWGPNFLLLLMHSLLNKR